jgi:hypothetical protein
MTSKVSSKIQSAIKGFVSSPEKSAIKKVTLPASISILNDINYAGQKYLRAPANKKEAYDKRFDEVASLTSNPEALARRIADGLKGLSDIAPKVGQSMSETTTRALNFLFQKAPKNPNEGRSINPNLRRWRPSDTEVAKWERYVAAVEQPMSVLEDLKHGRVSREGVEALKVVYPKLFGEVVSTLTEHLTELKQDLPYPKRLQLSVLFDVPVDSAVEPKFIAYMQQIHAGNAAAEGSGGPGGAPGPGKLSALSGSRDLMTDTQRLATRNQI